MSEQLLPCPFCGASESQLHDNGRMCRHPFTRWSGGMSAVPVFCEEYATIVADPPWRTMAGPLNGREGFGDATGASRPLPYPTMTVDAIKALQVPAANDAHLYLWTTNGYLRDAFDVARAWGFEYSTTLVWAKALMGGGLGGAYGISTEFCLYCRRGKLPALNKVGGTWFNWKRPYDERGKPRHSAKPPEFYALVEHVSPGPYLEMFARQKRSRWHAWGNEVENDVAIADRATPIAPPSERP